MRGFLVGLVAVVLIAAGAFTALLVIADAGAPEPGEIRTDVSDELGL
ncbi:MAG: hypothetical protein ACXIVL_01490 [Oceanicaulis sp.]